MHDSSPTLSDRSGVTDAVRAQILATEHWSLLATRSMTWNEMFSRAAMFLTVLSAAVVALALVAQATGFGPGFRSFALLVLSVVLLVGLVTYVRLSYANIQGAGLLRGMNRLRHAYLELAPELEPYFVTGHHDDEAGMMQSVGVGARFSIIGQLSGTPELVAVIDAVVAGVLAALVMEAFGVLGAVNVAVGAATGVAVAVMLSVGTLRRYARVRRDYHPRFPS